MRIISLVPSWTEFLFDIGVGENVVGKTKFCVRTGQERRDLQVVGGTKKFHVDTVKSLRPDLIVASKEENTKELVEQCQAFTEVLVTDVKSLPSAWETMGLIATMVNRNQSGKDWIERIQHAWGSPSKHSISAGYAIWKNPYMWAGQDTFIHHVMKHWGFENSVTQDDGDRYPALELSNTSISDSKVILLSSEPYPFQPQHLKPFEESGQFAQLADGEAFSWYGSRMLHRASYLENLSHEIHGKLTS